MKTVTMLRDYDYAPHPRRSIHFRAGVTYARVLEAAAREIERAGAGRILCPPDTAGTYIVKDASHAFRPGNKGRKSHG
jgi:hypothetical protein